MPAYSWLVPSELSVQIPDDLPAQPVLPGNSGDISHPIPDILPSASSENSLPIPDSLPSDAPLPGLTQKNPEFSPDTLPVSEILPVPQQEIPPAILEGARSPEIALTSQPDAFMLEFMTALNRRATDLVASLYTTDAVQVWNERVLNGTSSIQSNFSSFFTSLPATALFTLSLFRTEGDQRFFIWHAGSVTGETSLLMKDRKIIQNYTFTLPAQ